MLAGYLLTLWLRSRWLALVFSIVVMVLFCWVVLLAAMDIWASKRYFGRLRQDCLVEQAELESQVRRIQSIRGNGKGDIATRRPTERQREDGGN